MTKTKQQASVAAGLLIVLIAALLRWRYGEELAAIVAASRYYRYAMAVVCLGTVGFGLCAYFAATGQDRHESEGWIKTAWIVLSTAITGAALLGAWGAVAQTLEKFTP